MSLSLSLLFLLLFRWWRAIVSVNFFLLFALFIHFTLFATRWFYCCCFCFCFRFVYPTHMWLWVCSLCELCRTLFNGDPRVQYSSIFICWIYFCNHKNKIANRIEWIQCERPFAYAWAWKCIKTVNTIIVTIKMDTLRCYVLKCKNSANWIQIWIFTQMSTMNEFIDDVTWSHSRQIVRYKSFDNWNLELAVVHVWRIVVIFPDGNGKVWTQIYLR